jgi:hypothetical protein
MKLTILILTLCLSASAQSSMETRLRALAEVETGTKDRAIGRAGEVSRYQISPRVWRQYSHLPLEAADNPFTAQAVVVKIMSERTGNRSVTDAEWYLIYHRPARWNCPKPAERERGERFSAVCGRL